MATFNSFFFRTFSLDGESGILYLAIGMYGDNAYNCAGARQIGVHNGKQLWYIADREHGGYTDAMPAIAMFDPQPSNMKECNEQLENEPNDFTTLFSDGKSYWFVDDSLINKRGRSKSQKRAKKVTRSRSRGK